MKNVCSSYFSICGNGEWQTLQKVAPGTQCLNGNLVLYSVCEDVISDPVVESDDPTENVTVNPTVNPTTSPTTSPTSSPTTSSPTTSSPTTSSPTTSSPTTSSPTTQPCNWQGVRCVEEEKEEVQNKCTTTTLTCVDGVEVLTYLTEGISYSILYYK